MKTLKQISKELGVSAAAVSYVYNGKWRENRINEKLAARISKKLDEEGAAPDYLGRQLKTGRTNTIGVILTDLERGYNLELLGGIETALADTDYLVLLANSVRGRKEEFFINSMLSRKVDGLLLCPAGKKLPRGIIEKANSEFPVVMIDNYIPGKKIPAFISDNKSGMKKIISKCLEAGKHRIAYIGGHPGNAVLDERFKAFKEAISPAGLKPDSSLATRGKGASALIEVLSHKPDAVIFDSLIYLNDKHAEAFRAFPAENSKIMIAGFDTPPDKILKEFPDIYSVKQNATEMGSKATIALLESIKNSNSNNSIKRIKLRKE